MGKYGNYSFKKGIEKAQRRLNRLLCRKRCDAEKLEKAKKDFENAKLFESCQIFRSFLSDAPGKNIMFSDDNRVIWMLGHVIPYDDLASYSIYGTGKTITQTTTRARGVFSRAYIGHAIAGDVGAILGAATAPVETTTYDTGMYEGFTLYLYSKSGKNDAGVNVPRLYYKEGDKLPKKWRELLQKLKDIINKKI